MEKELGSKHGVVPGRHTINHHNTITNLCSGGCAGSWEHHLDSKFNPDLRQPHPLPQTDYTKIGRKHKTLDISGKSSFLVVSLAAGKMSR